MEWDHSQQAAGVDYGITALGMALCALCVSFANIFDLHVHPGAALSLLSLGIAFCLAGIALPSLRRFEKYSAPMLGIVIRLGLLTQTALIFRQVNDDPKLWVAFGIIAVIGFWICQNSLSGTQRAGSGLLHFPQIAINRVALVLILAGFLVAGAILVHRGRTLFMDVLMFQQRGCQYLLDGINPYAARYPNMYPLDPPVYGPGVVGPDNFLTFGYPYPPLSLLMVLPAYLLAKNVSWAHLAAMALSAWLMAIARPDRSDQPRRPRAAAVSAAFLLTPISLTILYIAWTEPLLVLTFSLVMYCACRWRAALPYALGIFLSTKQYSVLALPLVWLLVDEPNRWKEYRNLLLKALLVVAVINVPFFFWNPRAFYRAVVLYQLIQPFRPDALSYTARFYLRSGFKLPIWMLLVVFLPIAEGLRRAARSPAGFAAALTLVCLVFFALNKQAFCNYYYFAIATAWWSVAADGSIKSYELN